MMPITIPREMAPYVDWEDKGVTMEQRAIQNCIIHQLRNSSKYVSYKDLKALMADLKMVYAAVDEQTALDALDVFAERWDKKYPKISQSWRENWPNLSTYFKYPQEVRRLIYTTNAIEGFNRQLRKVTKAKSVFPTDDSLFKMLYLAMMDITKKWTGRRQDWSTIYAQLVVFFGDRILSPCSAHIERRFGICYSHIRKHIMFGAEAMRTKDEIRAEYARWLELARDPELSARLQALDGAGIEDAFYQDLAFGTAGLRGVMDPGTNRMNRYTVAKASQGLANYLRGRFPDPSVAVAYDSRRQSESFARAACGVFAANGVRVHLYPELMPTPCLSWAVRALDCSAGVMITASHNPAPYNGYKVYGPDGCQITTRAAEEILGEIEKLDLFRDTVSLDFDRALERGLIRYIPREIGEAYLDRVLDQSVLFGDEADRDVTIVYSPLNGTGRKPVLRALERSGFRNIAVVREQEEPDGDFPTCPYPNPEAPEAMALGLEYCRRLGADLFLATDPDCDRCGVAVRDGEEYRLLSGNEVGILLLDYICAQRSRHGKLPRDPVFIKTIVTTDLAEKIAARYGVRTVNVLTGFKFIGEVMGGLEAQGREEACILGFEESCGYLTGPYIRDKDGVDAVLMICEMYARYRTLGLTLPRRLEEIYREYGYCLSAVRSFAFPGPAGMGEMGERMAAFRREPPAAWGGEEVEKTLDYAGGLEGLPPADVIKYFTPSASVVIRPSGTEPKLKAYISVTAPDRETALELEKRIAAQVQERI